MNLLTILAALQATKPPGLWALAVGLAAGLLAVALAVLFVMRRYFRNTRNADKEDSTQTPGTQNPSAFMAASMQGVIQKLRDQ
jgi:hypothetical protein